MKEKLLVERLIQLGYTIASAESCTGGLFASTIVNVADASKVIKSSVVTYSNEAKIKYCKVKKETIEEFGVVSEMVAIQMAKGIREECNSNIGVSFTGLAGPAGGDEKTPVGTVCIGIAINYDMYVYTKHFDGDRQSVRSQCVDFAISEILNLLKTRFITVTGLSGSGKSTLTRILADKLKLQCIKVDDIVSLMYEYPPMVEKIKKEFGEVVLDENKKVTKKLVSNLILNDKKAWDALNEITWEYVEGHIDSQLEDCNYYAVLDYLFVPFTKYIDKANINILVKPKDIHIRNEKVCNRDDILVDKITKRDSFSPKFDDFKFDYIIENDYTDEFIDICNKLADEIGGKL